MIKKISVKNIQSHRETELELSRGINAIVGSSNNGKTAILRALNWARYNRPLGIDNLASHWALNEKGNLAEEMSVTVENDNGIATRKRTKSENQYIVNGKVLNVVKSDVPDEVEAFFNLSETNIQNQQDAPFLISKSSGEVAKYFNRVVRLDVIDRVLTNAESKRRKTKNEIESTERQVKDCEAKLESYAWFDTVEKLLNKYERVEIRNNELKEKMNALRESVEKYNEYLAIASKYDFDNAKKIIEKIESEKTVNEKINADCVALSDSVSKFEGVKVYPDFSREKKIIEKLIAYNPDRKKVEKLKNDVYMLGIQKMHIENSEADIRCLQERLPAICPLCGNPMKNGVCKNERSKTE